jgi:hypothetical protein
MVGAEGAAQIAAQEKRVIDRETDITELHAELEKTRLVGVCLWHTDIGVLQNP